MSNACQKPVCQLLIVKVLFVELTGRSSAEGRHPVGFTSIKTFCSRAVLAGNNANSRAPPHSTRHGRLAGERNALASDTNDGIVRLSISATVDSFGRITQGQEPATR